MKIIVQITKEVYKTNNPYSIISCKGYFVICTKYFEKSLCFEIKQSITNTFIFRLRVHNSIKDVMIYSFGTKSRKFDMIDYSDRGMIKWIGEHAEEIYKNFYS